MKARLLMSCAVFFLTIHGARPGLAQVPSTPDSLYALWIVGGSFHVEFKVMWLMVDSAAGYPEAGTFDTITVQP